MSDTPRMPVIAASDPRKWIPAIVGAVVLGEALWSLLQLLLRDWAAPAILNLMGQGPTPNQSAFVPQPLVIAFVEACIAGIFLVLLMSWSGRRARVVRVIKETRTEAAVNTSAVYTPARVVPAPVSPAPAPAPAPPIITQSVPGAVVATSSAPGPVVTAARVETPVVTAGIAAAPAPHTEETAEWTAASESPPVQTPPAPAAPVASAPKPPTPVPAPKKSKKPKTVYYNIVGEPIESDE